MFIKYFIYLYIGGMIFQCYCLKLGNHVKKQKLTMVSLNLNLLNNCLLFRSKQTRFNINQKKNYRYFILLIAVYIKVLLQAEM